MELSIVILAGLFLVVLALFAFCLTEPRGKNTVHARKNKSQPTHINEVQSGLKKDPISQSYNAKYRIKNNKTEAA
jgi:plastocyanin domain-containing protein